MKAYEVIVGPSDIQAENGAFLLHTKEGNVTVAVVILGTAVGLFAIFFLTGAEQSGIVPSLLLFIKCLLCSLALCTVSYFYLGSESGAKLRSVEWERSYIIDNNIGELLVSERSEQKRYPLSSIQIRKGLSYHYLHAGKKIYALPRTPNNERFLSQLQ